MDKERLYGIYHTVLSAALAGALAWGVNEYFILNISAVWVGILSVVAAVLVYITDQNKKNTITYVILFSLVSVAVMVQWARKTSLRKWVRGFVRWCREYNGEQGTYSRDYALTAIILVILMGCILFYMIMKSQIMKQIFGVFIFVLLIIFSILGTEIDSVVVGICLFYVMTILLEQAERVYSRKRKRAEKREGILYLSAICMILGILAAALPSKPEPIQWTGIKNMYIHFSNRIDEWIFQWRFRSLGGYEEFSMGLTGYSEDNKSLGREQLNKSEEIALSFTASKKNAPVYLIGSVSNRYTGDRWEKDRESRLTEEKEYLLDYIELVYALSRLEEEVLENNRFVERNTHNYRYREIFTNTFFYPGKTSWHDGEDEKNPLKEEDANIVFRKAVGENTKYQTIFYELNLGGEAFQEMLRGADSFSYNNIAEWKEERISVVKNQVMGKETVSGILDAERNYAILKDRAQIIYDKYTELPDELPQRVRDLAEEITEGKETVYDKLKAIEEYLIHNFTYDTQPGRPPKNHDFIDFFLFDNKKGYCTSFATAMAILPRCVGIPTRYVEGFMIEYEQEGGPRDFIIRNSRAHSWTEVYFEGIGWIPFEATPGFHDNRYTAWKEKTPQQEEGRWEEIYSYPEQPINDPGIPVPEETRKETEAKGTVGIKAAVITVFSVMLILLTLWVYYRILRWKDQKEYGDANDSDKMYRLFLRIIYILGKEGYPLQQGETLAMMAERVGDSFVYEGLTFTDISRIFMGYRYGQEKISPQQRMQTEVFYQGLYFQWRAELNFMQRSMEDFLFLMKKGYR